MLRHSDIGNVKKLCGCGRAKWSGCAHPWYVDFKAPKDHPRRPNERYRKHLELAGGKKAGNIREAQDEARRAITAWLDGRDPLDLQPNDRPPLATVLKTYTERPNAGSGEAIQVGPITTTKVQGKPFGDWKAADVTREALDAFRQQRPKVAANRNLALLRAMFNWAVADDLLPRPAWRQLASWAFGSGLCCAIGSVTTNSAAETHDVSHDGGARAGMLEWVVVVSDRQTD